MGGNKTMAWGAGIVLVLLAVCGGVLWFGFGTDKREAKNRCKQAIEQKIKTPATADFSFDEATTLSDSWYFTGYVDAENMFGAKVRSNFRCTVTKNGMYWNVDSFVS